MSHFTVLVIGDDYEKQLAPFQENNMGDCQKEYLEFYCVEDDQRKYFEKYKEDGQTFENYCESDGYKKDPKTGKYGYWENPNTKWDWYQVGGRWNGFFKMKKDHMGLLGEKSWASNPLESPNTRGDSTHKESIDIEGMKKEDGDRAGSRWDEMNSLIDGREIEYKWTDLLKKRDDGEITIDEARELYNNQEVIKDFNKKSGPFSSIENFLIPRDEYVKNAENSAISTFAVLKDGKWYEKGSMGWWGMVSDEKDNWDEEFSKLFDSLPGNTLLTIVDCHI
ncbi:hypothetical protein KAR91_62895 [Candidatus Pacearchaeota archaeon]|nr:hypothetical protein [Candidatus Pacearchaeota archaeon]